MNEFGFAAIAIIAMATIAVISIIVMAKATK